MLHHSDAAEKVTPPSTSTAPPPPLKAAEIILSDHPLEQSMNQSRNLGANIHITRPTTSQQQTLHPRSTSTSPAMLHTSTSIQTPTNDAQEDVPDLVDILATISRRLSPRERQALIDNLVSEQRTLV
jgi:hypothetical protein